MDDFDWDDSNRDHIARHGVTPEEAEQVYRNHPLDLPCYEYDGEVRCDSIGETEAGRILLVVTTLREQKVRVVTCFQPGLALRKEYLEYRSDFE